MIHALLSPSSAHRWMRCAASVPFTANMPNISGPAALDGLKAHDWAARRFCSTADPAELPPDWYEPLQQYVDYIADLAGRGFWYSVEEKVNIENWTGERGAQGTTDFCSAEGQRLHVVDLKFGVGDMIYAESSEGGERVPNAQLAIYALGLLDDLEWLGGIEEVELHIYQPRRDHVHTAVYTVSEIRAFGQRVKARAAATADPSPEFSPSATACKWCPGRGRCQARAAQTLLHTVVELNDIGSEELATLLKRADETRAMLKDMEDEAFLRIKNGAEVGGYKIVESNTKRRYNSFARARLATILGSSAFRPVTEPELVTITEAAKLVKKTLDKQLADQLMEEITEKPKGAPTLANPADPRPSLSLAASEDFKE